MHYSLEVIMPPVGNIEKALKEILAPFDEQGRDEDGAQNQYGFYDYYVIGGRFAGRKLEAMLDQDQRKEFHAELTRRGITVSGIQFGKQELSPASQIPEVDALWNEFFPESPVKICPIFKHFNDQYKNSEGFPDVMKLKDVPQTLISCRVIIAKQHWKDDTKLEAEFMIADSEYNGVNFVNSKWDGTIKNALEMYSKKLENYNEEAKEKYAPKGDWLVVTIDYHS